MSTPSDIWYQVDVRIPPEVLGALSDALFKAGAQAVTELVEGQRLELGGPDRDIIEEAPVTSTVVRSYFQGGKPRKWKTTVETARNRLVKGELRDNPVDCQKVEEQDWSVTWKEGFKPVKVSPHVVLKPTWENYDPQPGEVIVEIDPGMAFGTGAHETTRGCITLIDYALRGESGDVDSITALPSPVRVLDVGTGTGVLAIAALKLGAVGGWAVDIDPLAVEAATDNSRMNHTTETLRVDGTPIQQVEGQYPLVVANILAGALVELSPAIRGRMSPAGYLILSGLLNEQADRVAQAYQKLGLTLRRTLVEGDWSTLLLVDPS